MAVIATRAYTAHPSRGAAVWYGVPPVHLSAPHHSRPPSLGPPQPTPYLHPATCTAWRRCLLARNRARFSTLAATSSRPSADLPAIPVPPAQGFPTTTCGSSRMHCQMHPGQHAGPAHRGPSQLARIAADDLPRPPTTVASASAAWVLLPSPPSPPFPPARRSHSVAAKEMGQTGHGRISAASSERRGLEFQVRLIPTPLPATGPSRLPTRCALARVAATMVRPCQFFACVARRDSRLRAPGLTTPSDDASRIRARRLDDVGTLGCVCTPGVHFRAAGGHTHVTRRRAVNSRVAEATERPPGPPTTAPSSPRPATPRGFARAGAAPRLGAVYRGTCGCGSHPYPRRVRYRGLRVRCAPGHPRYDP